MREQPWRSFWHRLIASEISRLVSGGKTSRKGRPCTAAAFKPSSARKDVLNPMKVGTSPRVSNTAAGRGIAARIGP